MEAIRKHGSWHLYCRNWWAGGDLGVFRPVADIVEKLSLSAEKSTRILGIDCLVNLKRLSISGDVSEVDFTKFTTLHALNAKEGCKGGNWHLCESLDYLLVDARTPNLKKLKALKNLRTLICGRGLKSLEGIADLTSLFELRMGPSHLPSLESFGLLPNLRLLLVNLFPKLVSLKGVEGLPNLEGLDVTQCAALRDVSAVSALKNLRTLTLHYCPQLSSLDGIEVPTGCTVSFGANEKVRDGF
jgi:hypothetical protein